MRDTFTRCLEAYAQTHPELVLVTGDLGFGVLFPYMEKFPDRFINAGISEQAMVSMAAGMALEGKTVVVYSIGNFPTLRCLEQIRNCCAYHEVNVKIVCVGAGFVYGTLGMTHHATEDMSALRILPGVKVYAARRRRGDGGRDGPLPQRAGGGVSAHRPRRRAALFTRTGRWRATGAGRRLSSSPVRTPAFSPPAASWAAPWKRRGCWRRTGYTSAWPASPP